MLVNYLRNLGSLALGREPVRPLLFSFYATHRCTWDCRYCSDGAGNPFRDSPTPELSPADAGRLFALLRRETASLDITGGEPLMRRDLEDLLERARALGFQVTLNTKGGDLPERPELLRLCDTLILGVDALDPVRLADVLGGRERAEIVFGALKYALAGRRGGRPRIVLGTVAMPDNLAEVERVLALAEEEGCGFQFSPQIVGMSVHPGLRGNEAYRGLADRIADAKRRGARVLGVPAYFPAVRDFLPFRCYPLLMPIIRPDGRLYYPCLEYGWADADILAAGSYKAALEAGRRARGQVPECQDRCHLFCHMGMSLLQRHPLAALGELRIWAGRNGGPAAAK